MSTFTNIMIVVNILGLILGIHNMMTAYKYGLPQTGNVIAWVMCLAALGMLTH